MKLAEQQDFPPVKARRLIRRSRPQGAEISCTCRPPHKDGDKAPGLVYVGRDPAIESGCRKLSTNSDLSKDPKRKLRRSWIVAVENAATRARGKDEEECGHNVRPRFARFITTKCCDGSGPPRSLKGGGSQLPEFTDVPWGKGVWGAVRRAGP